MFMRVGATALVATTLVAACANNEPAPETNASSVTSESDRKPAFAPTGKPERDAWLRRKRALTTPSR